MKNKKIKITLPKNCEVEKIKTSVEDNCIVVEYIPKFPKFKEGDIIFAHDNVDDNWINIFGREDNGIIYNHCSFCPSCNPSCLPNDAFFLGNNGDRPFIVKEKIEEIRLATKEETKILFYELKKRGLQWNEQEKRVEKIRWRAEIGEPYFFVDRFGCVCENTEYGQNIDNKLYFCWNYFKFEEEAQKYADKIREILKKREL